MKKIALGIALLVIGIYSYKYFITKQIKGAAHFEQRYDTPRIEAPINVTYFQDGTRSIARNGVEVITSQVFSPYYNDTRRDIQLNFGIISELTAKKLIPLELKANRVPKPIMPDWKQIPFEVQNEVKRQFSIAQERYAADSTTYCIQRSETIAIFRKQVDTAIAPYLSHLASSTDLIPAIKIADKAFSYCFAPAATNYLILNSDGLDSRHRHPAKLSNPAEVILVNANGNTVTNLDNVVTRFLQSSEQAIDFTLNNHTHN